MNDALPQPGSNKRVLAGVTGIILGALGVHKFVLGYTKAGVTMLLVTIIGSLFLFAGPLVMGIIGLIEGILYLTKSDREFTEIYVAGKKEWF